MSQVPFDEEQECRVCGCSNECACVWAAEPQPPGPMVWDGPCEWVEYDLCSRCVAEPADEPQAALTATCANCRGPIARFNTAAWTGLRTMPGRWRHDNGGVTCGPTDPAFDHLVKGDSA